eukprot:1896659-Amphidinium_carterae.1
MGPTWVKHGFLHKIQSGSKYGANDACMVGGRACCSTTQPLKVESFVRASVTASTYSLPSTTTTRASSVASGGHPDWDGCALEL